MLTVPSILLTPLALYEFLAWAGASTRHLLYNTGVFALTALLAGYAARRARVPYAALLAGLASLVTWLFVWARILDHPSADTYRWLLVAAAALLLLVAARFARANLLVASLALVWVGSRVRARGMGYIGAIGLLAFVASVGTQIARLDSGRGSTTSLAGWPLVLLIAGVACLAAPALYRRES